jgi:hypothetical protein
LVSVVRLSTLANLVSVVRYSTLAIGGEIIQIFHLELIATKIHWLASVGVCGAIVLGEGASLGTSLVFIWRGAHLVLLGIHLWREHTWYSLAFICGEDTLGISLAFTWRGVHHLHSLGIIWRGAHLAFHWHSFGEGAHLLHSICYPPSCTRMDFQRAAKD